MHEGELQLRHLLQLPPVGGLVRLAHAGDLYNDPLFPHRLNDRLGHTHRVHPLPDHLHRLVHRAPVGVARQLQQELRPALQIQPGLDLDLPLPVLSLHEQRTQAQRHQRSRQCQAQPHPLAGVGSQEIADEQDEKDQTQAELQGDHGEPRRRASLRTCRPR